MTGRIMPAFESYERARREFAWDLPDEYNPALDCLRSHDPEETALYYDPPGGRTDVYTFGDLDEQSDRLAAALASLGVSQGDRVAVAIPQKPQNPVTHLANWKLGAVSVPLTVLFGRDALEYRLEDSGAVAAVVDPSVRETVERVQSDCPDLTHVISLDGGGNTRSFDALCASADAEFDPVESTPATETAIMYTSGSTGPPKGVLHSHALWLGRAAAAYNYFDQGLDDATVWTPADWAWGAALGGTLFATWHYGSPIVARPREGFDPETAFEVLARHGVTHSFMPPTALRHLMTVENPKERFDLSLSVLAAAGEPLTPEIVEWIDEAFDDVAINEFYGQTELNLVVGNSSRWFETRPESMGKPLPGYDIAVVDPESREPLPRGETGELAVRPDDRRVFFDEYWGMPDATADKQLDRLPGTDREGPWFLTGDLVERDADGYLWFVSRTDDVILTRGYRVGPMEVESAVLEHPAVEQVGVVGVPDETIGEAIEAVVQPTAEPDDPAELRTEIRTLVRERLAEYEYPDRIIFVDSLPTTSTGKIRRASLRERDRS